MKMVQCKFIKKDGRQCLAQAIKGQDYCLWHSQSEQIKKLRLSKAQIGGFRRRKYFNVPTENLTGLELRDIENCSKVLEIVVRETYEGRMSPQKANAVTGAVKMLMESVEKTDLLNRVKKLEEVIKDGRD